MKKFNVTYEQIASYSNIYAAYLDARKGKSERNEIMRFSLELDAHLNDLYNDLQEERYKVSGYRIIYIYVPKKRLIMALQFRDRVLQWAVYRLLNPLYEKTYIKDSYACIKERGREKAASRLQYWLRQTERKPKQYYYLKLDISKFFYRVDHEVLLNILKRRIKDERLIKLFDKIINSEKRAFGLPLGVDPCEIDPREMLFDKGMPIGNLTSQMFANIYMNELDQYLKHELHLKYVIRYADDCIILHDSKEELWQVSMINLVKSLRNGCAHNNCIIADLNPGSSTAPAAIYRIIKKMPDINKNQRQKKLSCRAVLEFVSMLCVYDMVVSEKVKKHRINELKQLFDVRIREKKGFFQKNQLITSTFDFVYKVIKNLFG